MKRIFLSILILAVFFNACSESPTKPEEKNSDFERLVKQLDKNIYKLEGTDPEIPFNNEVPLKKIATARYIGLGEATHGTREFFQMKHKIFRYLVKKHGFRVLAIEAQMGESYYIDRYVAKGSGNLGEIMKNKMIYWTWKTREVKHLLEWMHDYNQGKPKSERLYYIGINCQYMTFQPGIIEKYFQQYKPDFVDEVNNVLSVIRQLKPNLLQSYKDISLKEYRVITDTLIYLKKKMAGFKNDLIAASSAYQFKFTRHLIENLQQANKLRYYYAQGRPDAYSRDQCMTENAIWISELLGENVKVAVWGHNGHIQKGEYFGRVTLGGYLERKFENDYKTIGFGFSVGKFRAVSYDLETFTYSDGPEIQTVTSPPYSYSANYLFYKAQYQNFILNIDALPEGLELKKRLSREYDFIYIGSVYSGDRSNYYVDTNLSENFDIIVYINKTDYSRPLMPLNKNNIKPGIIKAFFK